MKKLKIALSGVTGEGREWSFSVAGFWLWGPLTLAAVMVIVAAGLCCRRQPQKVSERDHIVPLNVRDPSALVMAPSWGKCSCPCPTAEKIR